ncbi:hypothetical protein BD309DRAFT_912182 [Dichomitus squalens]|uniref:uncharacterized protein n=1 Tax=Dichomitus squalens (strain LYAD-421) TaxID=732165 RepID=UPI0004415B0E|nr:uncharacterized protein DICSQDRAFT_142279 [Dichomitus squalens LYAD-421 SS1]EJF66694.1 hypothetical protein DICSQDRAFT_142279 [Dichomitus squalens LYAD-421 SS1]TBU48339.1 hypothetical protein BD309DRAFT_912182 [Dichomitus squalens]
MHEACPVSRQIVNAAVERHCGDVLPWCLKVRWHIQRATRGVSPYRHTAQTNHRLTRMRAADLDTPSKKGSERGTDPRLPERQCTTLGSIEHLARVTFASNGKSTRAHMSKSLGMSISSESASGS